MHCKDQYARKHAVKVESLGLMHQPSYMMFSNFKSLCITPLAWQ